MTGAPPIQTSRASTATSAPASVENTSSARTLRPLAALLPFLAPYKKQIALALLFLLLAAAATLALPAAIKSVVDHGFAADVSDSAERLAAVRRQFLLFIPLALAMAVFTSARFFMVTWLGERVTADLRAAVYSHVLQQSPQFFETLKTGEVLSRLTTDTTVIQTAVGSSISMGLRNTVLFLGGPRVARRMLVARPDRSADAGLSSPRTTSPAWRISLDLRRSANRSISAQLRHAG